jgi:hypothetical protein
MCLAMHSSVFCPLLLYKISTAIGHTVVTKSCCSMPSGVLGGGGGVGMRACACCTHAVFFVGDWEGGGATRQTTTI